MSDSGRRRFCGLALAAAPAALLGARIARAEPSTRDSFHYQEKPNGALRCSLCVYYVAGTAERGMCRIIDGEVLSSAWCVAFRPR
jgi:hypothetical protein